MNMFFKVIAFITFVMLCSVGISFAIGMIIKSVVI